MIRNLTIGLGVLALLAGCDLGGRPSTPGTGGPEPVISLSGTAVMGVGGGSGQSTRVISGVKDLELAVGVALDG